MIHERDPDAPPTPSPERRVFGHAALPARSEEEQDYRRTGMPPLAQSERLLVRAGHVPPEFPGGNVTFYAQDQGGQWFQAVGGAWEPMHVLPSLPGKTIRGY